MGDALDMSGAKSILSEPNEMVIVMFLIFFSKSHLDEQDQGESLDKDEDRRVRKRWKPPHILRWRLGQHGWGRVWSFTMGADLSEIQTR